MTQSPRCWAYGVVYYARSAEHLNVVGARPGTLIYWNNDSSLVSIMGGHLTVGINS